MRSATSDQVMRLFIAILLPDDVRETLERFQLRLRKIMDSVSWVSRANMHLSLSFIGEQPAETADTLMPALDRVASSVKPFYFRVSGTGFFGRPEAPRVIWAGVQSDPGLRMLHESLTKELRKLHLPVESRPFSPHITLGRIRRWRKGDRMPDVFSQTDTFGGPVRVTAINLMKSTLDPGGAIYENLHSSLLAAGQEIVVNENA